MKTLLTAAALGAITLTGIAVAQTSTTTPVPQATAPVPHRDGMRGGRGMMRADANHDGVVTRDEMTADVDRRFARIDSNRDGKIDAGEMQAMREAKQARRSANGDAEPVPPPGGPRHAPGMGPKADPNGDGTITRDEYRARALQRFDRLDANRDGRLDASELPQRPAPGEAPPPPAGE